MLRERIISFVSSSVLAGMMSAFVLLPSLLSLRGEKDSFHLGFYATMDLPDLFSRFYTDSFRGNISTCLPNIYCGVLICVLTALYLLNKNIRLRERLASLGLICFLILNLFINTLNVMWHGFNRPIGFPYRYSFLLTFFMLLLSYRGSLVQDREKLPKNLSICLVLYLAYSAFILIKGSEVVGLREIILDGILFLLIAAALFLWHKNRLKEGALLVILGLLQLTDLGENIRHGFYYFEFAPIEEYQTYIDRVGKAIDEINSKDPSFFRMEKTFKRTHNDSMQFNYAGLTHYSSTEKKDVISYMKKLGFRDNGNWSFYDGGSTALVDSVFGIKYIISHYDYMGKKYKRFGKTKYKEGKSEKFFTYKNQYVLPLMFSSDRQIADMDDTRTNPFEFQNALADSIYGGRNNMFTPAQPDDVRLKNLTEKEENGLSIYRKIDPDKEAYIEYIITITAETDGKLLEGYFDSPDYQNERIMLNDDDKGEYFSEYHWSVLDFAKHDEGEKLSIRIIPGDDSFVMSNAWIYFEDMVRLKQWVSEVSADECSLEKITSSHLKGSADISGDRQLVFSFPYEKDWEVLIDGKRVETQKAAGLLLSTAVEKGKHEVELIYHQAGRIPGIMISLLGLLITAVTTALRRRKVRA